MHIILAPDSFKGSLTALEAAQAMQAGALRVLEDKSTFDLTPLADGGEGTLDAILAGGGERHSLKVCDPLLQEIQDDWGILPDNSAVIEMAQASGLTLIPEMRRDALRASTFGTGQLIKAALDHGCREMLIGIGGSATTDGGAGCLEALGARFRDAQGKVFLPGGVALANLAKIDLQNLDPRLRECRIKVLCDVTNPLCGPNGAAFVYAPQKGASAEEVQLMDRSLSHFADVAAQTLGRDLQNTPGAGAAGGLGFGLLAFLNAQLAPGIDTVLEVIHFAEKLQNADLVLTGEGSLDEQTLHGKTIAGVAKAAAKANVPVLAFGGRMQLSQSQLNQLGVRAAFAISDSAMPLEESVRNAKVLLGEAVKQALHEMKSTFRQD
jgi:glycerate kinase